MTFIYTAITTVSDRNRRYILWLWEI